MGSDLAGLPRRRPGCCRPPRGPRPPHARPHLDDPSTSGRGARLLQVRELPEGRRLQVPRRLQLGGAGSATRRSRAASRPIPRATTRRALALAARARGSTAHIVMPSNAPAVKKAAVEGYGATITYCEPTLEARESTLAAVLEREGRTPITPYDHPPIIAGQGTAALELLDEVGELDVVVPPVGGGGLASAPPSPSPSPAPASSWALSPLERTTPYRSLQEGRRLPSVEPKTIADGLCSPPSGEHTFPYPVRSPRAHRHGLRRRDRRGHAHDVGAHEDRRRALRCGAARGASRGSRPDPRRAHRTRSSRAATSTSNVSPGTPRDRSVDRSLPPPHAEGGAPRPPRGDLSTGHPARAGRARTASTCRPTTSPASGAGSTSRASTGSSRSTSSARSACASPRTSTSWHRTSWPSRRCRTSSTPRSTSRSRRTSGTVVMPKPSDRPSPKRPPRRRSAWASPCASSPTSCATWRSSAQTPRSSGATAGVGKGVIAVGMGGAEVGYSNDAFVRHFDAARAAGLHTVAHAGETGTPDDIRSALDDLGAERIGHGVAAVADDALLERLARERTPLEVCPSSNVRLGVAPDLASHPFDRLRNAGVEVSLNSDDPPLFETNLTREYSAHARRVQLRPVRARRHLESRSTPRVRRGPGTRRARAAIRRADGNRLAGRLARRDQLAEGQLAAASDLVESLDLGLPPLEELVRGDS